MSDTGAEDKKSVALPPFQEDAARTLSASKKTKTSMKSSIPVRRTGFTLVELLVVIAIIAVLATLVVTAAGKFRQKAREVSAINSIRQVASANMSYSMENFGDINVLLDANDPRQAGANYVSLNYWGRLQPYLFGDITATTEGEIAAQIKLRLAGVMGTNDLSKMTGTFQQGAKIYTDRSGIAVPFAFNNSVYLYNKYIKTSQFTDPALVVYFTYGFYRFNGTQAQTYYPMPTGSSSRSGKNIDYFPSKRAAFTFLDGHIEILSPPLNDRHFPSTPAAL
jgi:prepilin-type N-terminal cleavage/methylation domain-containing protein